MPTSRRATLRPKRAWPRPTGFARRARRRLRRRKGPLEEGEAHFFAGCDENHEPLGMGLAVYAFERDHARPGKAKTVAVFASELG